MTHLAVRAEGLGKRYEIAEGRARNTYRSLRDSIVETLQEPWHRLRHGAQPRAVRELWALTDVSFEVEHGEVLGIIGRNGAGKSTLLKILSRITRPTRGRAEVCGRVGSLLEVGTGFHPELTGRENIYLNGAILGMSRADIRRRFDEIVAFAELEDFLDTPVKRYSSGMYMRLAFSVAAHLEPDVLVVDEVLAVGDAAFQKKCLGKMATVAGEGRTVLFVSHNIGAVTRLCSRALLLDSGRVLEDGPAVEVTGAYLEEAVGRGGERRWLPHEAPGTDGLKLTSIIVRRGDGQPAGTVEVGDRIRLELGYRVSRPGLSFRCSVMFFMRGVCAFTSMETTEDAKEAVGTYYSEVSVPPHLLAEGQYVVWVSIFTSRGTKRRFVSLADALAFQVVDPMNSPSARGDYTQQLTGVVRPWLEWKRWYDPTPAPLPPVGR